MKDGNGGRGNFEGNQGGQLLPTKKGVTLSIDSWTTLLEKVNEVNEIIDQL